MSDQLPVLFQAHGAPMLLDDPAWIAELAGWARALPRPQAILVLSAHWEARPTTIGATRPLPLIYDFYGFPDKFYQLTYPSPGAPALATRVRALCAAAKIPTVDDETRGLDHGTYIPLLCMYPEHDIPVLQISLPSEDPVELYALGRALAPLRDEGVLVIGSGFITHNLRALRVRGQPAWAREFDAWTTDVIARADVDALMQYKTKAPGVREALPTHEHFVPLIVAAAAGEGQAVTWPITGWWMDGPMTRRSAQFG